MSYYNYTNDAIYELEKQRTMNYGEESDFPKQCELCGRDDKAVFVVNSRCICEDCACNELRDAFEDIEPSSTPSGIDAGVIFNRIIDDFTDSELISYIEDVYTRI